jgi:hypothetical protein
MIFDELAEGQIFKYSNRVNFVKIKPVQAVHIHDRLTFNSRCIDTNMLYYFTPSDCVEPDSDRENFEKLWESNKGPIDKALCYKFYKLGLETP